MVKVHKTNPKTVKKGGTELKNVQNKIAKPNATKSVTKKVKKTLVLEAENVKTKGGALKNGGAKKIRPTEEVFEPLKKIEPKKKAAAAKTQQNFNLASALGELSAAVKKSDLMKMLVKSKVEQTVENSALTEKESGKNTKKGISKKQQVVGKLEKPVKVKMNQKHVAKKNSAFELNPKEDKKEFSKKKPVVKKSVVTDESEAVKNVLPKKKIPMAKAHKKEQKNLSEKVLVVAKEEDQAKKKKTHKEEQKTNNKLVGNGLQNKSVSKIEKSLSAEKKNKPKLKNKVGKNVGKVDHKDQEEPEQEKSQLFEQDTFDEKKFKNIVSLKNIKKVAAALKVLIEKTASEKKTAVFSDYKYFLNVGCYKIPNCPKRMVKLNLKHALVDPTVDDVVLIVPDLKRGSRVDYEDTIQHYDDILRQQGIEKIKVLPMNQLKTEYSSIEAKRKLSNLYDHYLCDGRIVGHVVGHCGNAFQKPRSTIHAVTLSKPEKYKKEIEQALKRTSFRQLRKGDLTSILVGDYRFTADQLTENIESVINQLETLYPGGYPNIRNMYIRTHIVGAPAMPLYVSMLGAPEEIPNVIGPREQRMLKLKKQANEVLSKFSMTKSGEFVKLNKTQVKRKQEIREAREALTSKGTENDEGEVAECNPPSKKKPKKQVEPQNTGDSEASGDDVDVSEEDYEANGEVSDEDVDEGSEEDDVDDEESEECSEDDDE